MSKIEELINQYCPEGVKFVKLGEVCEILRGKRLTKKELFDDAQYKVFHGGLSPIGYYTKANRQAQTVMVINVGASAGTVGFCDEEFWSSDGCFCLSHNDDLTLPKYLYYYLATHQLSIQSRVRKAGIPTLDASAVKDLEIPLPPLPIQEKIAEILDKFSLLTAELEAELDLQKKRYDYYRNRILSFDSEPSSNSVQWRPLGEVGTFTKGCGILKSDFVEQGFPCIHYGQVHTKFHSFTDKNITFITEEQASKCRKAKKGDLIIASTSEDVDACCKAVAWIGDYDVAVSGDAHIFSHNQNPKYVSYLFQTEMFQKQKRPYAIGAKVIRVRSENLDKFILPFPPLAEQERIVNILDRFEALVTNLSNGLPAEIERVRKQYEYYRNKLLTFPIAEQ